MSFYLKAFNLQNNIEYQNANLDQSRPQNSNDNNVSKYELYSEELAHIKSNKTENSPKVQLLNFKSIGEKISTLTRDCDFEVLIFDLGDLDTTDEDYCEFEELCNQIILNQSNYHKVKKLILISSVGVWAKSEHINPAECQEGRPFLDSQFILRRPVQSFTKLYECERCLLKMAARSKMCHSYIICPGLVYGNEQQVFDYFFKTAWEGETKIPIFGIGENKLPTIHVNDLGL